MVVVCLSFVLAWWLTPSRQATHPSESTPASRSLSPVETPAIRGALCSLGCALAAWTVGGLHSLVVGAVGGFVLSWYLGKRESAAMIRRRIHVGRDLPLAVDLLAACARAGLPLGQSLRMVSAAVGGPLADELAAIDARLQLGADPASEWRRVGRDPQLGGLGRVVLRSVESGAPLVDGLERLAADRRREQRMLSQQRARSVGVKAAAPLAGCFLPAFMLIGVVPTVVGGFIHLVLR